MNNKLSEKFINRELSWIEFNKRVLDEAKDPMNPLFERLRFLSIVSSNLDEFFMVRVGSLTDQHEAGFNEKDAAGYTPAEQLIHISSHVHTTIYQQCNCFNRSLKPSLSKENIKILTAKDLSSSQLDFLDDYYIKEVFPVITPMAVDKSSPFPLILNKSLNIGVLIDADKESDGILFATVQVPSVLKRLVELPSSNGKNFILLEDLIKLNLHSLFGQREILAAGCYRITRNADLTLDEEGAEDLLEAIEESIKQRKWGATVRLEFEHGLDSRILTVLREELEVSEYQEYEINTPLDLTFLSKLASIEGYPDLSYPPLKPKIPKRIAEASSIFDMISEGDLLLHHPYETFDPVVNLVKEAAEDPDVLAIKQTLYRVSGNSPIVKSLILAAENGKQVTVLVELKARFDEENNIIWAKQLEKAGCHVIYGLVGLKTHCKLLLVVRREKDGIKRYVHMGTGNYNDVTARVYSDLGLFSKNHYYGSDASSIFNMLSGRSIPTSLNKLCIAPISIRDRFVFLINQEAENARKGKPAKIIAKMNSIVDKKIIECLYDASAAGVKIELIIRGICCLRPGIPGISDNITVRSIVGRFLEHSRIFYFYNNGEELIYLSSADWMTRNLDKRVELLFPVENPEIRSKVKDILTTSLQDTIKAKILGSDGLYSKVDRRGKEQLDSQMYFMNNSTNEIIKKEDQLEQSKIKWLEEGFRPRFGS